MKRSLVLILTFLFISATALPAQDVSKLKFEKFTSKEGKYTANFPGKVMNQKKSAKTDVGEIQINLDLVPIGNDLAFIISFNDYPDSLKSTDPEKMLIGVRDGNKGVEGELISDEAIAFGPDKLPGRKVLIKKPGETYMRTMMVLKGTRLYQVMVVGKKEQVNSKAVDNFQKSFQLTK